MSELIKRNYFYIMAQEEDVGHAISQVVAWHVNIQRFFDRGQTLSWKGCHWEGRKPNRKWVQTILDRPRRIRVQILEKHNEG